MKQMNIADTNLDPRSTEDLIHLALTETDEDAAWDAITALHFRGNREVLDRQVTIKCHYQLTIKRAPLPQETPVPLSHRMMLGIACRRESR